MRDRTRHRSCRPDDRRRAGGEHAVSEDVVVRRNYCRNVPTMFSWVHGTTRSRAAERRHHAGARLGARRHHHAGSLPPAARRGRAGLVHRRRARAGREAGRAPDYAAPMTWGTSASACCPTSAGTARTCPAPVAAAGIAASFTANAYPAGITSTAGRRRSKCFPCTYAATAAAAARTASARFGSSRRSRYGWRTNAHGKGWRGG